MGDQAALGIEMMQEPMSVTTHQEKLLDKLNLDGLSNWTPRNVAAAKELVLAFHNIFALDGNKLNARDFHQGPCVLWTGRALQALHKGVRSYCEAPL